MSFKLTTAERRTRDELQVELAKAWEEIVESAREYNQVQANAKSVVEDAVSKFNQIAEHAKSFTEAIAERAQEEINARSETWRESNSGDAALAWSNEWQAFDINELDPDWPEELDIDQPDMDLTELPEEAACAS